MGPTTPHTQPLPGITRAWFSLLRFRSPLLTESRLFSPPAGTEMFHFPAFPPHTLYIQVRVTPHDWGRVSPFGHPRITARLAAPRGLSRPPTSFIGSWCQGIHRAPLLTWPQRCSHPLCSSQRTNDPPPRPSTTHPNPPWSGMTHAAAPSPSSTPRQHTSVCSLRTQQRTDTPPHHTHQPDFPHPAPTRRPAVLTQPTTAARQLNQ